MTGSPWSYKDKTAVVRTLVLPKAFYGSEAAPPSIAAMDSLSRAIAKAVGPYSQGASNLITQHTAGSCCIEPAAYLLLRRCMLLRRMLIKHTEIHAVWQEAWKAYAQLGHLGAASDAAAVGALRPCPPPGYSNRAAWMPHSAKAQGPVGLLLDSLVEHKAIITGDFIIHTWPVLNLDLLHHPIQGLRATVTDIATAAQFEFLASNRSGLKDLQSFDKHTYCTAARTIPASQQQLVRCAQSFGMWSAGRRLEVFQEGNGRCPFCGDADSGVIHEVWSCRAFAEEQALHDEGLGQLSPANTPTHILLGFPPKIDARLDEFLIPFIGDPIGWPSYCKANALLYHHGRLCEDAC